MDTTQLFLHYVYKTPSMNLKREYYLVKLDTAYETSKLQ